MTISSEIRKAGPFDGNGSTTSFPFTFKVFAKTDIRVVRTDTTRNETTLTLDSDYGVALNADQDNNPGGTVTYPISGAPLSSGYKLTLVGDIAYTQPADITNAGAFYPQVIENALDRSTVQIQQLNEQVGRALTIAVSDTADTALPPAAANMLIGWNGDASALENIDPAAVTAVIAYGTSVADQFTGTGSQTAFTLSANPGALNNLDVSVSGAVKRPGVDYTWAGGTTLNFASAPANASNILVKYKIALPQGTLDAASVTFTPTGTIASTNVQAAIAEVAAEATGGGGGGGNNDVVSIKQAPYNAVGDGTTDDTAAFTAAEASSLKRFFLPEGTYIVNGVSLTKFYWGNGKILLNGTAFSGHIGSHIASDPNFNTTSTTLSAGASAGATSISVASASLIRAGCRVRINDGTRAESHTVYNIVGTTLTFNTSPSDPLVYSYSAGATVDVSNPGAYGMEGDISRTIADKFSLAAGTRQGLDKLYFDGTTTPRVSIFANGGGHSGVSARLMANAAIGATSITVNTAGADFAVNRQMGFTDATDAGGANYLDTVKITSIVGNVVSFTPALTRAYKVGSRVSTAVRTMNQYYFNETTHSGGGDSYCWTGRMIVDNTSQQGGQNHFFYTATGGLFGGDLVGVKNGVYLTGTEINQVDAGYNIAAIGDVRSFQRANDPRAQIDTTLAAGVSAGATSISLTTAAGALTSGGTLTFFGSVYTETQYVSSVSGSNVTLLQGTNYAYSSGVRVVYQASCARTTLSAGASPGATTITVANNAYMATGTSAVTITDGVNYDTSVVANVVGTTITLSTPLNYTFSSGAAVLIQNETVNPFGTVWMGALYKSESSKSCDAVVSGVGRWKTGINLGMADFSSHNNAAIVLSKGHRIYFNSYRSYDVAGVGLWANYAGDTYQHLSTSGRFEHVVGNRVVMDYDHTFGVMRKSWGFDQGLYTAASTGVTFDGSGGGHKILYDSSYTRCRIFGTDVMLWDSTAVYVNAQFRSGGGVYLYGASATTASSAAAGGASALPAAPFTYITVHLNGTPYKIPVYNN